MNFKYKSLLKDSFTFLIGSLGSKMILFALVPLYTHYMTDEDYGIAELFFTFSQLIVPFLSLVVFDAVIRFGLSKNEKKEDVLLVGFVVFSFSIVVCIGITPVIGLYQTMTEWRWYLCLYVVSSILNSIEMNYLKVKGKNKLFAFLSIVQTGLMAGLNILLLVCCRMGVQGYILSYLTATIVVDILAFFAGNVPHDLGKAHLDQRLLKHMLLFSSPLILNNVSWWVIHSSDKIMIERMVSASALGIYTAAAKIPSLINVFVTVFQQAWGISTLKESESTNDAGYYATVFRYYTLISCAACIGLVSVIKLFMRYYVGQDFQSAWQYVPLLLVSAVFASIAAYYGSLYGAMKKSVNNMITTLIAAIVNILFNFLLIPYIGVWGAVVGTVCAYIAVAFARIWDVNRFIKIKIEYWKLSANLLIVISQGILVTVDQYGELFSALSIVLFVMVNWKEIRTISWKRRCKTT